MYTDPVKPHRESTPVVSVRLDLDLLDALDALAARTGRSRGFYLREALRRHLPSLVETYWADEAIRTNVDEEEKFRAIMMQLLNGD